MTWKPSENLMIQLGHGAGGAVFILVGRLHHHVLALFVLLLVWLALKEFVFDIYVEEDGYVNGLKDCASYFIGAAIGMIL